MHQESIYNLIPPKPVVQARLAPWGLGWVTLGKWSQPCRHWGWLDSCINKKWNWIEASNMVWLVVWICFNFPYYWEQSSQLTNSIIFQRGWNHQTWWLHHQKWRFNHQEWWYDGHSMGIMSHVLWLTPGLFKKRASILVATYHYLGVSPLIKPGLLLQGWHYIFDRCINKHWAVNIF